MDLFFFIFDRLNTSGVKLILKALINQNCRWSQYPPVAPTSPPRNLSQEDSQHVFQSSQAKLGQCLAQQPFFLLQQHREASYGCGSQVPIIQKAAPYLRGSTERERKMGKQNQSNLPSAVQQTDSSLVHLDSSVTCLIGAYGQTQEKAFILVSPDLFLLWEPAGVAKRQQVQM